MLRLAILALALVGCTDDVDPDDTEDTDVEDTDDTDVEDTDDTDVEDTDTDPPAPPITWAFVSVQGANEVVTYAFDHETGGLTEEFRLDVPGAPGPLSVTPDGRHLIVGLVADGGLAVLAIDADTGVLRAEGRTFIGMSPVYVHATDNAVLVPSYSDDRLQAHTRNPDGSVVTEPISAFPTAHNPHSITLSPDGATAWVPATNSDIIEAYNVASSGALSPAVHTPVAAGSGPRHMVHHPSQGRIYAVNEHADSVTAYATGSDGVLTAEGTVSTLPGGVDGSDNTCADVHITPDGRFLYASNRGHDSIAMFTVDATDGHLTPLGQMSTEPRPREFALDPEGRFLYALGQDSGRLAAYSIGSNGTLAQFDSIEVGANPTWIEVVAFE